MDTRPEYHCILCGNTNLEFRQKYELEELIKLWEPIVFSGKTKADLEKQNNSTSLFYCPSCELEMFLPQIIGNDGFYEDLSTNSKANYYENEKWDFYEALNEVEKGNSIIEIGCGPGRFLELAKRKGANIFGTEFNRSAIAEAQKKGFTIFDNDFDKTKLYGKFDVAFSFHVLEHIESPLNFIGEIYHLVRKGGLICISVPNQDGPIKFIDPCIMNMPPHHATRWRLKTFIELAKKFNMQVVRFGYEPLLLKNRYYYSYYWLMKKINKQKSLFHKVTFWTLRIVLELFFLSFKIVGFKYYRFLKGQAIYIVMQK